MPFHRYHPDNTNFHYTNRVDPQVLRKCYISSRAFLVMVHGAALASVNRHTQDENGFFLYGTFIREDDGSIVVCVDDATDGGPRARASTAAYCFDEQYVNHRLGYMADDSREVNRSAVGLVHIHPGSMDYFSHTDVETFISKLLPDTRLGLLTGLINIDPVLRMTMYFIRQEGSRRYACYNVPVLVSDEEVNRRVNLSRPRSMGTIWRAVTGRNFPGTSVPIADDSLNMLTLREAPVPVPASIPRPTAVPKPAATPNPVPASELESIPVSQSSPEPEAVSNPVSAPEPEPIPAPAPEPAPACTVSTTYTVVVCRSRRQTCPQNTANQPSCPTDASDTDAPDNGKES